MRVSETGDQMKSSVLRDPREGESILVLTWLDRSDRATLTVHRACIRGMTRAPR